MRLLVCEEQTREIKKEKRIRGTAIIFFFMPLLKFNGV
jgi:hypothetical protein